MTEELLRRWRQAPELTLSVARGVLRRGDPTDLFELCSHSRLAPDAQRFLLRELQESWQLVDLARNPSLVPEVIESLLERQEYPIDRALCGSPHPHP